MNLDEEGNTEELARLASQGDPDSVAALARRSISSLFDFAVRVTLDETTAKAVVESTLNRALGSIEDRPPNLGFRAWMFGIARDEALDTMRARGREGAESGQISPMDERFTHLGDETRDPEMALWTWQAARAQRPRDYSLLDLAIRRRVPPEEIADIASLSRSGIYAVLGRLRGAFEESFFTSTLYFRGRENCTELDKLVTEATSLGPAPRRDIGRHADGCAVCKETRNGLTLAADILGSFANVTVPEDLRERLAPAPLAIAEAIQEVVAPALGVEAAEEDEAAPGEEPVEDAAELAAEIALHGQTLEEDEAVVEEAVLEEAALLLPDLEPEAEPVVEEPAAEDALEVADPVAEVVEDEEPAEAVEAIEQPVAVPLAAGLAGVGGITVLAAAEDALLAGSAATVKPHARSVNGNGALPAHGLGANGAEAMPAAGAGAAALLPATDLPGQEAHDEPAADEEASPALEDALVPLAEPAEALDAIVVPIEGDEGVEPAQAALAAADTPSDEGASVETISDPEALVAAAAVTELVAPGAETVEADAEATEPETEVTVVDDDGAITAADKSTPVEDSAGSGTGSLILAGAGAAAASGIAASSAGAAGVRAAGRGGGGQPPRSRTAEGSEGGKSRGKRNLWLIGIISVATIAAAYVGIALGDSIRSGGETPSQPGVVLPTRAPGVREVACGTAPIAMQQGTRATLTFAAASLPGYEVANAVVQPISPTARTSSVEARAQQGLSVLFEAFTVPPVPNQPANQVDEYRLVVTFSREQERTTSDCTVLVSAGAIVPTNTPRATVAPTQPPPATPTQPAPSPTSVSTTPTQIVPTPPPLATPAPTQTPEPEPEPQEPTQTPVPTNTRVPPTNTPTVTGTPPTATPPPTYTPTPTPPVPTRTPVPTPTTPPAPLPTS